jgi:hypothetical protein
MDKKKPNCYMGLFNKIDHIDARIGEIREQLAALKENFITEKNEEMCPDELEAEEALLEIITASAIAALLETDPQGDA